MSLVATLMQNLRVKDEGFYKNSLRMGEYGALELFVEQSKVAGGITTPELKETAFRSVGRTLQIPVYDPNTNITVSTSRSCTISDAENTSKMVNVSFSNISTGFTMVPNLYLNNEFGYQQDWNMKMKTVIDKIGNALDVLAVTALGTNKSQVFADTLGYTVTGNSVQVPYTKRVNIFGDVKSMMRANRFRGNEMHIVGNPGAEAIIRNLGIFGKDNAQDLTREFMGNRLHYTTNIGNAAQSGGTTYSGAFYAVAPGMVGFLSRVSRPELNGTKTNIGHEWGNEVLPGLGITVGTHYYQSVGDMSSIASTASADMVCDLKEHFGFSVDVCFLTAYNSAIATIANPIIKGDIEASSNPTIAMSVQQLS